MAARTWGLIGAVALAACAPRGEQRPRTLLEQGRLYTTWLYGNQYQKLWDRFSPEMRESFGSVGDLASFAGRAVTRLGPERRAIDERVDDVAPFRVYQRTASFDTSRRPMLIEWSLANDGEVTGFVVRPVPDGSVGGEPQ
ncbi:MAG TPA: hypothetical protein VMY76_12380 [Gemmatimonadales bacterium]|nr:hypothetical protein [Gemmatimonadales bacterium]